MGALPLAVLACVIYGVYRIVFGHRPNTPKDATRPAHRP